MNAFFDYKFKLSFEHVIVENFIIESSDYMKSTHTQYIVIKRHHMKIYYLRTVIFYSSKPLQKLLGEICKVVNGLSR